MVSEKASAAILADAAKDATGPAAAPSRTDLRHVLALLPRPRKPSRTAVLRPGEVQETR